MSIIWTNSSRHASRGSMSGGGKRWQPVHVARACCSLPSADADPACCSDATIDRDTPGAAIRTATSAAASVQRATAALGDDIEIDASTRTAAPDSWLAAPRSGLRGEGDDRAGVLLAVRVGGQVDRPAVRR